jgi:hypothetical protein
MINPRPTLSIMSNQRANAPPSGVALDRWEWEGGNIGATPAAAARAGWGECLPELPPGYAAQPIGAFHDASGRFSYEFNFVYEPVQPMLGRSSVVAGRLDRERSYWLVTWPVLHASGEERPAARWLSFAQAKKQQGPRLTFTQFSSVAQMRGALAGLPVG